MLVPISWLDKYVDVKNENIDELERKLIMTGSNTEGVENLADKFKKIIVGKIISIENHPNADSLFVMKVDIKEEMLQIITSAKNCSVGDIIPVAVNGAYIADGTKIKRGKLRGELSDGMLCSVEEMGFSKNVIPQKYVDGIFILRGDYKIGENVKEELLMNDPIIDFEITPNRPDCLSMLGMAKETAATLNKKLVMPDITVKNEVDNIEDYISIEVKDVELCQRYAARVIKNVKIEESPSWLQLLLMKAGVRPINNIVDITNYVMLEYGQPIHAFDLDTLKGNQIIVRKAKNDEKIITLDGVERKLKASNLLICDSEKPVAIAGVMGGFNTEIKDDTKTILIEVANFNAKNIRESSKSLGLRTEASARYEKGISPSVVEEAINRICNLVETLNAGEIVKDVIDNYPNKVVEKEITVRVKRVNKLLGTEIEVSEMIKILEKLNIKSTIDGDNIKVIPPLYRLDLNTEIDFVEEVARIYGYENIESTLPAGSSWGEKTYSQTIDSLAKTILFSNGVSEITTYSFISPSVLDNLRISKESYLRRYVEIENPLGEEFSMMRTTLIANILKVIKNNYNRNIEGLRLFELGNIFIPKQIPVIDMPYENKRLVIGSYGKNESFYTIKGVLENLLNGLGIEDYKLLKEKNDSIFHPGKCATILWNEKVIGMIGEVHPKTIANFDMNEEVYIIDLDFKTILENSDIEIKFEKIAKYPTIQRDIALLVKKEVTHQEIIDVIKENGGNHLESVTLFDIYEGKQIEDGYKSMAYNLTFRSSERTLKEKEVTKKYNNVISKLEDKLEITLR
jgi:phenylalanyl-tRNA synthetase beta chain